MADLMTNAQLAQLINDALAKWNAREAEQYAWVSGSATGGPNGDGRFPLSNGSGGSNLIDSPAKLADTLNGPAALAGAARDAALTFRDAAQSAATAASTDKTLANNSKLAAQDARDLAMLYRDQTAALQATVSVSEAAVAAARASVTTMEANVITLRGETLVARDEAVVAKTAAEAAAALAATFNPNDFYTKVASDGRYVQLTNFNWSSLSNKPGVFPPEAHTHIISEITGLQAALDGKQAAGSYASATHTHIIADVTGLQTALDAKAPLASPSFTGNVGIGATPSYRLHVNSGAETTVGFFQSTGTSSFIGLSNANYTAYLGSFNDGSFRIQTAGSGFSDKLTVGIAGDVTASVDLRAPIFYDSGNTGYYVDPASTSALNIVNTAGYIQTYSGGVKWDESGVRSWSMYPSGGGMYVQTGDGGGALYANLSGGIRSYIFYDSDNTSYYIDPTGNTVLNTLWLRTGSSQSKFAYPSNFGYSSSYKTVVLGNEYLTTISMGVDVSGNASGSFNGQGEGREVIFRNGVQFITPNAANNSYLIPFGMADGYAYSPNSLRAPIFYDTDNTGYYLDPAGSSYLNTVNAGIIVAQSSNDAQLYLNGNGTSWAGIAFTDVSGGDNLWYNGSTSTFAVGGGGATGTNKKLHVNGGATVGSGLATSNVSANGLLVEARIDAPIYYDSANTAYYVDPASTSNINQLNGNGKIVLETSDSYLRINQSNGFSNGIWLGPSNIGGQGELHLGSNGTPSTARVRIIGGTYNGSVAITLNGADGSITAAGNVTAYSDARLKDNIQTISGAVSKVLQLNGVTYTRKDLADTTRRYAGLIAQDVQKVLPEAVKDLGGTLGVDYSATIGLLVEAIKELTAEIETLKSKG